MNDRSKAVSIAPFDARLHSWHRFYRDEAANNQRVAGRKGKTYSAELTVIHRLLADKRMCDLRRRLIECGLTDAQMVRFADAAMKARRDYSRLRKNAADVEFKRQEVVKHADNLMKVLLELFALSGDALDSFEDDAASATATFPSRLLAMPGAYFLGGVAMPEPAWPHKPIPVADLPNGAYLSPMHAGIAAQSIMEQASRWKCRPSTSIRAALGSHKAPAKLRYLRAFWTELERPPSLNFDGGLSLKKAIVIIANVVLHPDAARLDHPNEEVSMRDVTDARRGLGERRKGADVLQPENSAPMRRTQRD